MGLHEERAALCMPNTAQSQIIIQTQGGQPSASKLITTQTHLKQHSAGFSSVLMDEAGFINCITTRSSIKNLVHP